MIIIISIDMNLQTKITIAAPDFSIDYNSKLMMLGSCFAENMGGKFSYYKFDVDVNPCGIIYNPRPWQTCCV